MTPTIKQKKALKEIVENGRTSISAVMRDVGYSDATATHPDKLTESKGWKELLEQYLPDGKLLKKHDEALEAVKWNDFTGEKEPDQSIRLRATELGYKLKNKLTDGNINISGDKVIAILGGTSVHKDEGDIQDIVVDKED